MTVDYSVMTKEQKALIDEYCKDDMKKLKQICYFVWGKNGLPSCYHDDLYSDAMNVLSESVISFNPDKKVMFKTYLTSNISKSYKDWYRDTHLRAKRNNLELDKNGRIKRDKSGKPIIVKSVSFDSPNDGGIDLCERIASNFEIETNLDKNECFSKNTVSYLESLSPTQKEMANLIMEGYSPSEIKEKVQLNDKQYENHMKYMRSYEKASILKQNDYIETEEKTMSNNQTFEKSKVDKYPISSIIKKMNNKTLRYDHPLQRESDQHSTKMKSNLISDILQNNPIPALVFAEQIINGVSITWNIDGKQRSTNVKEFTEDKFKISKSVRRSLIKYQAMIKDENGEIIPDENGLPQAEWREFDIANKKFSQLPDELQDRFMDYCFDVTLYINCSDEDIAYHIERYNDGKQMASSQKGVVKLGEDYARMIKGISNMPFFSENGFNYTQKKNGTIDRVCIESVMATEFLDDWKSSPEDIATFLKKNAKEEHFDNLEDTVERLEKVITEDVGELFDKKDTFIYFSVFARFKKTGLDDGKFIEFLTEYAQSLHNKFDEIEYDKNAGKKRSTKDKCVVVEKINYVDSVMREYLHIEDNNDISSETFVAEVVDMPVDIVKEEIDCYEETLESLENNTIKDGSKLLEVDNHLSLLAMVAYSYKNDVDLDKWMEDYAANNNMYLADQKKNYVRMVNDFESYNKKYSRKVGVA